MFPQSRRYRLGLAALLVAAPLVELVETRALAVDRTARRPTTSPP